MTEVPIQEMLDQLSVARSEKWSSDSVLMSEKKIGRRFFKNDVIVKSYKCDLLGPSLRTLAKLYISGTSIYLVHRPKRTKLTVIPFSAVRNIEPREHGRIVDIHITTGVTYALSQFDRAIPAVTFLLNFWDLVRKEKVILNQIQHTPDTSSSVERCSADSGLPTRTTSNTIASTNTTNLSTSSLNSTSTTSEADSVYSQPSGSINSLQSPKAHSTASSTSAHQANHSPAIRQRRSEVVRSSVPTKIMVADVVSIPSKSNSSTSPENPQSDDRKPAPVSPGSNVAAPDSFPTHNPLSHRAPSVRCPEIPSQNWSLWPLSFLPYPFTAPPQRLTVIIAYAILIFLLFSTMHLYHRLALFDLTGDMNVPILAPIPRNGGPHNIDSTVRSGMQLLDAELTNLVSLTNQMTEILLKLTQEFHVLYSTHHSDSTQPTCSTEAPPAPATLDRSFVTPPIR